MNRGVELVGEARMKVVADALGLGHVNNSDRTFEPDFGQDSCQHNWLRED